MSVLKAAILRQRTALSLAAMLLLGGIVAYDAIPREAAPDVQVPVFYASSTLEGASPEDAERLLARPFEEHLQGIDGLKQLRTASSHGYAAVILEFEDGIDLSLARQKVSEKVDQAHADMPDDAKAPFVNEVNLSLYPAIIVALSGDVPERTLFRLARAMRTALEKIPEALEVNLSGQREELVEVIIDPQALESYGLDYGELIASVSRNNRLVAAGDLNAESGWFALKVGGLFASIDDVYALALKTKNGDAVTVRDVAEIRRVFKDRDTFALHDGKPAMTLAVVKRIGSNIVEMNRKVREVAAKVSADWPDRVRVDFAFDNSRNISDAIRSLESAILTAVALVMIVCVAALGLRSALMVGLAVPTSFLISFLIAWLFGRTVNNMLMFGMLLTVGMLVDGAIVIIEYADRKMAEGKSRVEAYVLSAQRMFLPVASSTATTLAAFLPMLFWPGVPGQFMSNLPITVVIVLSASLLTAMLFIPALGTLVGRTEQKDSERFRALAGDGRPVDVDALRGFTRLYARAIRGLISRPLTSTAAAFALLGAIATMYAENHRGIVFFVRTDNPQAITHVRARGDLAMDEQIRIVREVDAAARQVKGIESVSVSIGFSADTRGGNVDSPRDAIGQLRIALLPYGERRHSDEIYEEVRSRTSDFPGIIVETNPREGGPPTGKDIRLQVFALRAEDAYRAAGRVVDRLSAMEGVIDIEDGSPLPGIEWRFSVDREEAGRYGADVASLGALVQMVGGGVLLGKYRPDDSDEEIDIRARLPRDDRSIAAFDSLRLQTVKGLTPVSNFTSRSPAHALNSIEREDARTYVFVKANVVEGVIADDVIGDLQSWLDSQSWQEGVDFAFRGADEERRSSQVFLFRAMSASILLMFFILVAQFNSFYHSLITLSTVVMSVFGVLIGMMVMQQPFSVIMTGTGIVALAGIVVNNAIVLIDTYQRMLRAGLSSAEATLNACVQRLRPVLLTSGTTIAGLMPMMFEVNVRWVLGEIAIGSATSAWWVQLATALVFGLGFATFLTLALCPVWLAMPERLRVVFLRRPA